MAAPIVSERKRIKKVAQRKCDCQSMKWIGGVLYFVNYHQPIGRVPGIDLMPKAGKSAIGYIPPVFSPSCRSSRRKVKSPKPGKSEVNYWDFPIARDTDGECPRCWRYPNYDTVNVMTDDLGMAQLTKCSNCGTKMRSL